MSYIRRIGRIACVLAGLTCAWLGLAAAAPAAIALSGIVAATAAPRATTAAASGVEQFRFMSTSATSNEGPVIARGVFTAGGVEIVTSNTTGIFKFPNGTIKFSFSPPTGPTSFNPRTCLFTANQHGTNKLLSGTGRYAGISGHGTYRQHVLVVVSRSHGKCAPRKPPVALENLVIGVVPVHL